MSRSRWEVFRWLAVLALTLALAAGCSSGSTSGSGGAGGSSGSGSAPAADSGGSGSGEGGSESGSGIPASPVKIAIGYTAISHMFGPLFVATDLGYFEENNLDVELVSLESSGQLAAALTSNSIQISPGDVSAGVTALTKGIGVVFLASDLHSYNLELWGKPDIQKGEGLRGRRIGVSSPGSLTDHGIRDYLKSYGLDPDRDVSLQQLGSTSSRAAALEAGQVDAIIVSPPQGTRTQQSGNVRIDNLAGIPHMSSVFMALEDYVDNNPEVIRAFMRGYLKGLVKVKTDYEGTKDILAKYAQVSSEDINRQGYDYYKDLWQREPHVDPELIRMALDAVEDQAAAQQVDLDAAIREEFLQEQIDNGYLEELYKNSP